MSGEDFLFLAGTGASGNPEVVGRFDSHGPGQFLRAGDFGTDEGGVVLHCAGNSESLAWDAGISESLGDFLVLDKNMGKSSEHARGKDPNEPISPRGVSGHSAVGHYYGDLETMGLGHEVVPDFQFHEDDQSRFEASKYAAYDPTEVEGEVEDVFF